MDFVLYILTNKQTNYHCMILIDFFVVLSKLFALIKFIVTSDYDVNSHLFFFSCIAVNFPNFNSPSQIIVQLMPKPMHYLVI